MQILRPRRVFLDTNHLRLTAFAESGSPYERLLALIRSQHLTLVVDRYSQLDEIANQPRDKRVKVLQVLAATNPLVGWCGLQQGIACELAHDSADSRRAWMFSDRAADPVIFRWLLQASAAARASYCQDMKIAGGVALPGFGSDPPLAAMIRQRINDPDAREMCKLVREQFAQWVQQVWGQSSWPVESIATWAATTIVNYPLYDGVFPPDIEQWSAGRLLERSPTLSVFARILPRVLATGRKFEKNDCQDLQYCGMWAHCDFALIENFMAEQAKQSGYNHIYRSAKDLLQALDA